MHLKPGVYELVFDTEVAESLDLTKEPLPHLENIDVGESHDILSAHLEKVMGGALRAQEGDKVTKLRKQVDLYNRIIKLLSDGAYKPPSIVEPPRRVFEVFETDHHELARADTPLSQSCLLTRTRQDPTLESQLKKEIDSSDQIDILCSFIKWTGLRRIKDSLARFTDMPEKSLRVMTTSYMGATDVKAVNALMQLKSTTVKVSYDHDRTRLHAKAYIFRRNSGFGTAYIGSSNMSYSALTEGLEWNVKISEYESPHLWQKMLAAFDTHWHSPEFEEYSPDCEVRLTDALRSSTSSIASEGLTPFFDLKPYPFQQEILDRIAAERFIGARTSHLVVAATGTGKTLVSAFDYDNFCKGATGERPSLLFVAHRAEILKQSLATFRAVLKDYNFGELHIGGNRPANNRHVFASVQTLDSVAKTGAFHSVDYYDYIVIDEFHHAAAPSYLALLKHYRPKCLLGLTATPERADGLDILHWFGGHISAEIRLPDAVNRKLLCPFQYFGVTDNVDLSTLRWVRSGYEVSDLERNYVLTVHVANARVDLIIGKLNEYLLNAQRVKALGFCVSVMHAEFMARAFNEKGYRSLAVTGSTDFAIRSSVKEAFRSGDINYVFTVDLFNEGVDIPEIDTVLFLRPTESLTVFLQQLGRGLRHSEGKECLTVLDFIGQAHKKYRYDIRYRALLDDPRRSVREQVVQSFPYLPAGCSIQLERVAQQHVLANISSNFTFSTSSFILAVQEFYERTRTIPTLQQFLDELGIQPDDLYRKATLSHVLASCGLHGELDDPDKDRLATGFRRIQHIGGPDQIRFLIQALESEQSPHSLSAKETVWITMASFSLFGKQNCEKGTWDNVKRLQRNKALCSELIQLLQFRLDRLDTIPPKFQLPYECGLELHAQYTRDELLAGIGYWNLESTPEMREGVVYCRATETDLFLVTLNKTEKSYSPTTMYADYAISDRVFHWQSQNQTSETSSTGLRYRNQMKTGDTMLLCVRESPTADGLSCPFYFLGPVTFESSTGSKPMSIRWNLHHPMPAKLLRKTAAIDAA